jgi:hypothetical protein
MKLRVLYRDSTGSGRFEDVDAGSAEAAAWEVATRAAMARGVKATDLELIRVEEAE